MLYDLLGYFACFISGIFLGSMFRDHRLFSLYLKEVRRSSYWYDRYVDLLKTQDEEKEEWQE